MPEATFHFPRAFVWGTSTSSHQVEGNNTNNQWWRWETMGRTNGTSGLACDWWGGRWREDFDRAMEGGQTAHRLSVEWSRIQPEPDRWNEDAIERYRLMLRGLTDRRMTAMITLHHFTDPIWLTEQGGWESDAVAEKFERFVRKTVEALKEYCTLWCTINEPNIYALVGYAYGAFPPGVVDPPRAMRVQANMLRAHARAYRAIHEIQREARVGYALAFRPLTAKNPWSPLDRWVRGRLHEGLNLAFPSAISTGTMRTPLGRTPIPEAKGTQDYLGINYYTSQLISFKLSERALLYARTDFPPGAELSANGFLANVPEGFYKTLNWAVDTYPNLPILVTENGVEDADDRMRPRYLAQHIHQLWRAVNFNWPIKAYFHWSLVDNFEWERGWSQRFGLWALDVETQRRTKRPSADLYAEICRENGLSSKMVEKYCPEIFKKMFPG
jgi:beta-glucosidase